jgi:starch phosphorylase
VTPAGLVPEPELLVRADCGIDNESIWQAHGEAKQALVEQVHAMTGVSLDPGLCTFGFARRMTAYKRPGLLFTDIARLKAIARQRPFQILLAGKAHPRDEEGKRVIEAIHAHRHELVGAITVVFLPNYDMALAAAMVCGVDVWLNTPDLLGPRHQRHGDLQWRTQPGYPGRLVVEGWVRGVTGWSIGTVDRARTWVRFTTSWNG